MDNPQKKYSLEDPLQYIKGVGPKRALLLEKLGLKNIEDCLFFLPFRYEDRTLVKKISELVPGERVTFLGEIILAETQHIGRRKKIFEALIKDETGTIPAKWFRFHEPYMMEKYPIGSHVILSGKPEVNRYLGTGLEIIHPDMERAGVDEKDSPEIGKIIPIYHSTEGLHVKTLRSVCLLNKRNPPTGNHPPAQIPLQRPGASMCPFTPKRSLRQGSGSFSHPGTKAAHL